MTDSISLTINVACEKNGYSATLEEAYSGSTSDTGGETLEETIIEGIRWAGVDLDLPENPSMDDIAKAIGLKQSSGEYEVLGVRVFGEIWNI